MTYRPPRPDKVPPHASLAGLRRASGKTLEEIGQLVAEVLGLDDPVSRGTLSAIESGKRGASGPMLDALAIAYGMEPGDLVTDYVPRLRETA